MNNRINDLAWRSAEAVDAWRAREVEASSRALAYLLSRLRPNPFGTVPARMGETIPFREGSCDLDGEARAALRASVAVLRANREMRVVIGGFASQRGSRACVLGLSLRRVEAIRRLLVQEGIGPDQIAVAIRGTGWCVVEHPGGAADAKEPRGEYRLQIADPRWMPPSD